MDQEIVPLSNNYHYSLDDSGCLIVSRPVTYRPSRLCIIGHARSGKDTASEILSELYGMTFESSSMAAARIFIYDKLKDKYGYETFEECFEDRMNHRSEWFDLICDFNKKDASALAREIMRNSDIYVGMRSARELERCKEIGLFDLVVWIDASFRVPEEPRSSFDISIDYADIIIENNRSYIEFYNKVKRLGAVVSGKMWIGGL